MGKINSKVLWAKFRFSIIGSLLSSPPTEQGELRQELEKLAKKRWRHPIKDKDKKFGLSTIERWYYTAKKEKHDPINKLGTKIRSDLGKSRILGATLKEKNNKTI